MSQSLSSSSSSPSPSSSSSSSSTIMIPSLFHPESPSPSTSAVASVSMNPVLKKRLSQLIQDSPIEDPQFLQAIRSLPSSTPGDPSARRQLRTDLETRCIRTNFQFMSTCQLLLNKLQAIDTCVLRLRQLQSQMSSRLVLSQQSVSGLISEARVLKQYHFTALQRLDISQRFLNHFQLSADEMRALGMIDSSHASPPSSTNSSILSPSLSQSDHSLHSSTPSLMSLDFFTAVGHLWEIVSDCKRLLLLGSSSSPDESYHLLPSEETVSPLPEATTGEPDRSAGSRTSLELFDHLSQLQMQTVDRLLKHVKSILRPSPSNSALSGSPLRSSRGSAASLSPPPASFQTALSIDELPQWLPLAFRILSKRPLLLDYVLQEAKEIRREHIVSHFFRALQRGGPGGVPKPIEIHSHDPLRFVGDLLAWLHQTAIGEMELFQGLFSLERIFRSLLERFPLAFGVFPVSSSPSSVDDQLHFLSFKDRIADCLDSIFSGLSNPLQIQIEKSLEIDVPLVVRFRISQLLDFYIRTLQPKVLSEQSQLIRTIHELKQLTLESFRKKLMELTEQLKKAVPPPPPDLSPPSFLHDYTNQMTEILNVFDASLVPVDHRLEEFSTILGAVLNPIIQACTISASETEDVSNMATYLINCLGLLQQILAPFSFTQQKIEQLGVLISGHMDTLIQEEASSLLYRVKLAPKYKVLLEWRSQDKQIRSPLSKVDGMDDKNLMEAMRGLHRALFDIGTQAMPQCDRLQSGHLRNKAKASVISLVCSAYEALYQEISDRGNKYESPELIVPYTPLNIEKIFGDQNLII